MTWTFPELSTGVDGKTCFRCLWRMCFCCWWLAV